MAKECTPENTSSGRLLPIPSVSTLEKGVAVGAATLYGALFLAYRTYYAAISADPEDMGVTSTYVLVRSPIYILTLLIIALAVWWACDSCTQAAGAPPRQSAQRIIRQVLPPVAATSVIIVSFAHFLCGPSLSWLLPSLRGPAVYVPYVLLFMLGPLTYVPALAYRRLALQCRERQAMITGRNLSIMVVVAVALILPCSALMLRANYMASLARSGIPFSSVEYLHIPLLDIEAVPVTIDWIGPPSQRPPELFGSNSLQSAHGLLLGRSQSAAIVRFDSGRQAKMVRLNLSSITISHSLQ
jgi:hypothetical protein